MYMYIYKREWWRILGSQIDIREILRRYSARFPCSNKLATYPLLQSRRRANPHGGR